MAKFRLEEAFEQANKKGIKTRKIDIAKKLWPDSKDSTQQVNMTSLLNGTTKRIEPDWVEIICKELDVTPGFLFDQVIGSRYLVTGIGFEPFNTKWFEPENHFISKLKMIVYDLVEMKYTKNGKTWNDIHIDHL